MATDISAEGTRIHDTKGHSLWEKQMLLQHVEDRMVDSYSRHIWGDKSISTNSYCFIFFLWLFFVGRCINYQSMYIYWKCFWFFAFRWWIEVYNLLFQLSEISGVLYVASMKDEVESDIILDMRREDASAEAGTSDCEYALVSEWMFLRAFKWWDCFELLIVKLCLNIVI